jgi:hypothetical protein
MIHQAGPLDRGVQRCVRCGEILGRGWPVGALVQVIPEDLCTSTVLYVGWPPDCPLSTEHLAANGKPIDGSPRQQA